MKLTGYVINDEPVGGYHESWRVDDLNGNAPFKHEEEVSEGYRDITSPKNWSVNGHEVCIDYQQKLSVIRDWYTDKDWNTLSIEEKDYAIQYLVHYTDTEKVTHLVVVKGMSMSEAEDFMILQWHNNHEKFVEDCKTRWKYAKLFAPKYLSILDSEDLSNMLSLLLFEYTMSGVIWSNYGDNRSGLMDYIESTSTFENDGLLESWYTVKNGRTMTSFVADLKDVIINGNYSHYL